MFKKKSVNRAVFSVLTVGALALTGCSGSNAPSSEDAAHSMYAWMSTDSDRKQWEAFAESVQSEDPSFKLSIEGPSFHDYWTKVKTRLAAPGAPCLVTTQAARTQELASLLAPLDELAEQHGLEIGEYNAAMIEAMTVDGSLRALPYDAEPMVLYYNKTLFDKAGIEYPGTTYTKKQFLEDAKALTTGDGQYGVAINPLQQIMTLAFAEGLSPTHDGELTLTDPAFAEAVQFGLDLVHKEGVAAPPVMTDAEAPSQQEFMSGKGAMLVDGPWMYETLTTQTDGEVGVTVIPSDSGKPIAEIQGSGFGIAETCADKEAAFEVLMKITSEKTLGDVGAARGTVPAIPSALDRWAEGKPASDVATVETLLEDGTPLITTRNWNEVDTLFWQYLGDGYRGKMSAEELLSTVQGSVK